jgi:hypothetical protein
VPGGTEADLPESTIPHPSKLSLPPRIVPEEINQVQENRYPVKQSLHPFEKTGLPAQ